MTANPFSPCFQCQDSAILCKCCEECADGEPLNNDGHQSSEGTQAAAVADITEDNTANPKVKG